MGNIRNEITSFYSKKVDTLLTSADASPAEIESELAELERRILYLKQLDDEYCRYVAHIVRKHRSSRAQAQLVSMLRPSEAFLWVDYKAKPLSRKHREGQSESFGKKGKSLFGLAAMFLIPDDWQGALPEGTEREGDVVVAHVRVCCDDSDQSVWHSIQVLTTSLLLLKGQYSWLQFGPLYSDGAVNFKSFLFTLVLQEVSKRVGFRITAQLLPEAGDGKDRCDRGFAGVNKLFDSWVKVDRRVMLCADDICDTLEVRATPGVINCALQTQRDGASEKLWKAKLYTSRFAELVGKKKEDLFYIDLVWEEHEAVWLCVGMRFFCYHGMGSGKYNTVEQLKGVHPGPKLPVLAYSPHITRGTTVSGSKAATEVKIEMGRGHKRRKMSALQEKRQQAKASATATQQQKEANKAARRTSSRCSHCDQPMLRNRMTSSLHQASCSRRQQKLSVAERENVLKSDGTFQFGVLQGCGQMVKPSSGALVPLAELCGSSNQAVLSVLKERCIHVEHSVACCVRDLVDTAMFNSGQEHEMPLLGWACREANVRAAKQFELEKHVKAHFGLYAGPSKCLRATQISGWVSSEVTRRKKSQQGLSVAAVTSAIEGFRWAQSRQERSKLGWHALSWQEPTIWRQCKGD